MNRAVFLGFLALAGRTAHADEPPVIPHMSIQQEIDQSDVKRYVELISDALPLETRRVVLVLNTNGGSLPVAHMLVKLMDAARDDQQIRTDCVVDGRAWSAGLYVLAACDRRFMTKRSTLMAHQPSGGEAGGESLSELRRGNTLAALEVLAGGFAEGVVAPTLVPIEDYLRRVEDGKEWWLGWRDALRYGFVDAVVRTDHEMWQPGARTLDGGMP